MSTPLFAAFGFLWIVAGFLKMHHMTARASLFDVVGSLSAVIGGLLIRRCLPSLRTQDECSASERSRRMLFAVTIIEAVAIATAAIILALLGMSEYIGVAIVLLVAVHLMPLAAQTYIYADALISGSLLAWSLGCLALLVQGHVAVPGELGAGSIMLACLLLRASKRFRADVVPGTWRES